MANFRLPPPYTIIRHLGKGGIGEIYLAYHENLQKQVIVKKVKDHCVDIMDSRIEVDILKNLHHRYLPQVYDFIQINGGIYTVMDYIPGHDLEYYCNRQMHFSEEQLLFWMQQLLEVLDYLHTRKPPILHCDIKPANIMIQEDGDICLIDFNISIDGESNKELIGLSSQFASPEQAKKAEMILAGKDGNRIHLDGRSDLYSLGAVFYFLMTGIYPDAKRKDLIELKYLDHGYSNELENIVRKAMQPDIHKRFKNAKEMQKALEHLEQWSSSRLFKKKVLKATAIAAVTVSVFGGALFYRSVDERKYRDFADVADIYVEKEADCDYKNSETSEIEILYDDGIAILNTKKYQKYLKRDSQRKEEVLYAAAKAALFLEYFDQAEDLLQEAVNCDEENAELYRDLAITEASLGDYEQAENYLREAKKRNLKEEDVSLIRAEIDLLQGDVQTAYFMAEKVLENTSDDLMFHAVHVFLQAAQESGHMEEGISFLQQKAESMPVSSQVFWLRSAARMALQMNETEDAGECLEKIAETGLVLLEDRYNLDAVYEEQQNWDKSIKILEKITEEYKTEYRACIRLAYVNYQWNNDRRPADRTYKQVFLWYEKAKEIMEQSGIDEEKDADMVQLKKIISQLEELGWRAE